MPQRRAFTLIELMVVIAIIAVLISILLPAISRARSQAKGAVCLSRLRTLGQGLVHYTGRYRDTLPPARMPKVNDDQVRMKVVGGIKYRPTFLTMIANEVGLQPFSEPLASRTLVDRLGQPGDRQNYETDVYVCPEVPDWVDERNGAFGYNYHFLGNARLRDANDIYSYKNWPVKSSSIRQPSECVALADSIGTAASFPPAERSVYEDNRPGDRKTGRTLTAHGNEGFNLDPPRVDPEGGEMAALSKRARTAVHPRHVGKANVMWLDAHGSVETFESLGYDVDEDEVVTFEGINRRFSPNRTDEAWLESPAR